MPSSAAGTLQPPDRAAEAWRAFDPPGEHPRLWCDRPAHDAQPLIANQLLVSGWALSRSDGGQVSVRIELGRILEAVHGFHRFDVQSALPEEPQALRSGWLARITTHDFLPGAYELRVVARDEEGRETSLHRVVDVDPRRPYAAWLAGRRTPGAQGRRLPRFFVCVRESTGPDPSQPTGLHSLERQSLPAWRLETASPDAVTDRLREFVDSQADYFVLSAAEVRVEAHALVMLAQEATAGRTPDVLYADEDRLDPWDRRVDPFFKPTWSPELLLERDYVGPLVCFGKQAVRRALALDPEPVGSAYELLLRLVDEELTICRIPDVLYTCSHAARSTERDRAGAEAAVRALADRRGAAVEILPLALRGARQVAWMPRGNPQVSVIVATAFETDLVQRCLRSIRERSTYENVQVVVAANTVEERLPAGLDPGNLDLRIVRYESRFNYSAINNAGAAAATGDFLLFLNDDTEVQSPDWIERLLGLVQQPGTGVAGAKLIYPGGAVQLGGVLLTDNGHGARLIGCGLAGEDPGYHGLLATARNQASVSGACMMLSRALFTRLEGFDETLEVELSDVDLCLRSIGAGERVVLTPHTVLTHHERASRGHREWRGDYGRFARKWAKLLQAGDPYYSPHLSTTRAEEFEICVPEGRDSARASG